MRRCGTRGAILRIERTRILSSVAQIQLLSRLPGRFACELGEAFAIQGLCAGVARTGDAAELVSTQPALRSAAPAHALRFAESAGLQFTRAARVAAMSGEVRLPGPHGLCSFLCSRFMRSSKSIRLSISVR
jgi:hypothetical protein